MPRVVVTREISHWETSPLKEVAELNMPYIVVTFEVSHDEMFPYLASAVVPSLSHSSTAPDNDESSNGVEMRNTTMWV